MLLSPAILPNCLVRACFGFEPNLSGWLLETEPRVLPSSLADFLLFVNGSILFLLLFWLVIMQPLEICKRALTISLPLGGQGRRTRFLTVS